MTDTAPTTPPIEGTHRTIEQTLELLQRARGSLERSYSPFRVLASHLSDKPDDRTLASFTGLEGMAGDNRH